MTSTGESHDRYHVDEAFPALYLIRVRGQLDGAVWSNWFAPMQISVDPGHDETTLRGLVCDRAALYGLLSRLRNLTLTPLLVQRLGGSAECVRDETTGAKG
jgi:hypothetical protein